MTTKKTTISSLILSTIVAFAAYKYLSLGSMLCYYAGDGEEKLQELRDACYAEYSITNFALETTLVFASTFIITYLLLGYFSKFIRKRRQFNS